MSAFVSAVIVAAGGSVRMGIADSSLFRFCHDLQLNTP